MGEVQEKPLSQALQKQILQGYIQQNVTVCLSCPLHFFLDMHLCQKYQAHSPINRMKTKNRKKKPYYIRNMFFFYLFSCESAALCMDLFNHHPGYKLKCYLIIHLFGSSKSQQLKKAR